MILTVSLPELSPRSGGPALSSRKLAAHIAEQRLAGCGPGAPAAAPGTAEWHRGRQAAPGAGQARAAAAPRSPSPPRPPGGATARGRGSLRGPSRGSRPGSSCWSAPPATPLSPSLSLVLLRSSFPELLPAGRTLRPRAGSAVTRQNSSNWPLPQPLMPERSAPGVDPPGRRRHACTEDDAAAACPQHGPASAQPAQPAQRCCGELAAAVPL